MIFNISRHIIRLICVMFLLLIQIDICSPLMDVINYQVEMFENIACEASADEVYYRAGKKCQVKAKILMAGVSPLINALYSSEIIGQSDGSVPKVRVKSIHHHIVYCIFRI